MIKTQIDFYLRSIAMDGRQMFSINSNNNNDDDDDRIFVVLFL